MPDHDFVAGSKYKLLPSVIGHIKVVNSKDLTNGTVSDSGPTLIVRRSAKHSVFFGIHLEEVPSAEWKG